METRKLIAYTFLVIVGIGVLTWGSNYLSSGTVTITTDSQSSTITLQKASKGKPFTQIGSGSLTATIDHGQYTATVKDGPKTSVQLITFTKGHKDFRYSVPLAKPVRAESVLYKNAQSIEATPDQMVYVDGSSGVMYQVNSQNDISKVGPSWKLQSVQWASPAFGVGQDTFGHLYTISAGVVSPLKVPFSYTGNFVNFAVSSDEKIYVSSGADVYAGGQSGSFKKIFTAPSSKPQLSAGTDIVAVSNSKYGGTPSGVSKPSLAVVTVSGKTHKKDLEAERVEWSPGGRYLASVNQANPTIYDTSLHQVTVMPTTSVVGQFKWVDDTTLLYTLSNQLWAFDMSSQKSTLLSNLSSLDSVNDMYISSDKSYVYISTVNSSSSAYTLKRVGLKGQEVPDYVYKLQSSLPLTFGGYSMTMVNFALPPTLVIQTYPDSPPGNYQQQATSQLQTLGLDPNQFRFQINPPAATD